jgi:hypothetical protein
MFFTEAGFSASVWKETVRLGGIGADFASSAGSTMGIAAPAQEVGDGPFLTDGGSIDVAIDASRGRGA